MGSLFSSKSKTQSQGSDTRNTTTENNYWDNPQLQQFLQGYNQQYSNAGGFNVPINAFQTGAAGQQTGVAAGLNPAFNTANTIGSQGIAPQAIQSFQNPYENQVVGNLLSDFNTQNLQTLDANRGRRAAQGALGNQTGADALIMQGQQDAQAKQLANTRMQGFNTAADLAKQSAGLQLQGAGTAGQLTGAATGANTGLYNMGQGMWDSSFKNAMAPYDLFYKGVQGQTGFGNLAGTTSNSTGTNTNTSTTTNYPGLGQSIMGVAGAGLSMYGMGVDNGWWGGRADGGGGKGFEFGGPVGDNPMPAGMTSRFPTAPAEPAHSPSNSFADKVMSAHAIVKGLRDGGAAPKQGFDGGGAVSDDATGEEFGAPMVPGVYRPGTTEDVDPMMPLGGPPPQPPPQPFQPFYGAPEPQAPRQREPLPRMSGATQLGAMLLAGSPIAGSSKAIMDMHAQRVREAEQNRQAEFEAARLLGQYQGQPTQAARQAEPVTRLNAIKADEAENPELVYARRGAMAEKYDLPKGSREYNEFVLTGDFPRGANRGLGLNPVYGTDEKGNLVIGQISPEGKIVASELPPGFTPSSKNLLKVDGGTEWLMMDPVTKQVLQRVPKNIEDKEAAEEVGKARGKAQVDLPRAQQSADRMLKHLDGIIKDPNLSSVTGWQANFPTVFTPSIDTEAKITQVQGGTFLQAFESLKGAGAITEKEGEKATVALNRLSQLKQSDKAYLAALKEFRDEVVELLEMAKKKAAAPAKAPAPGAATADPLGIR